jgi:hypothetical protein
MGDAAERVRLGEAAKAIVHRFRPEAIFDMWEQLFQKVKFDG